MSTDQPPTAEKDAGLEGRYRVEKINDPTSKHDDCRYFVLDPQHDSIAEGVLRVYAGIARSEGFAALADDLEAWVGTCHEGMRPHDPHGWWEVTIGGELWETCPGRPSVTPPGQGNAR